MTIPNSVTSIGNYAFSFCSNLTSVDIGNSVTSIGSGAFFYCSSLTSVDISNSVREIGDDAFGGCESLTSVNIGNSVTSIGNEAFIFCSGLTSVTIGNSVTSIGYEAFRECSSLTSVTINSESCRFDDYVFKGCDNVKELIYGKSCLFVPRTGLTSIEKVIISRSVQYIEDAAFSGCSALRNIYSEGYNPPECASDAFDGVDTDKCRLHVPDWCKRWYLEADVWREFTHIIEDIYDDEEDEIAALLQRLETGDIDGDGSTTAADVEIVVEGVLSSNLNNGGVLPDDNVTGLRQRIETGDIDGDGRTTAADVAKVVKCALKQ